MRYLLDTYSLIWFQEANLKIPQHVMQEVQNSANAIYFSQVSLFEIAIKQKIGKLPSFEATNKHRRAGRQQEQQ
jgi:PIN domain nuclease of toxin-antitoxin system